MTEHEKEIKALNFIILEQKDTINALGAERDKYKKMLEIIAKSHEEIEEGTAEEVNPYLLTGDELKRMEGARR